MCVCVCVYLCVCSEDNSDYQSSATILLATVPCFSAVCARLANSLDFFGDSPVPASCLPSGITELQTCIALSGFTRDLEAQIQIPSWHVKHFTGKPYLQLRHICFKTYFMCL